MNTAAFLNIILTANAAQANAALARTQGQLVATGRTATATSATVKKAMLGIGVAAGAAGVALFKVGEEFDSAYDKIQSRTGATAQEMRKLKGAFRDVIGSVPAEFDDAAEAVGGLSQRLGLNGRSLRVVSKQMTELSRVTETDVTQNVEAVAKAFVDWEVKGSETSKMLDGLFRLSQQSGMAVSDIAENIQKFGSPLRQLGFSVEEASAMFALFERAGVNIQTMVPGLKLAISNLTRPTETLGDSMKKLGIDAGDPEKALQQVFDLLGDQSNLSQIKKTGLAMDVFGKRAGADMAEAIRQGRFEFDEYVNVMKNGDGTIRETGRQTMDLQEHFQRFTNLLKLELEPVAKDVFKGLGDLMQDVSKAFKRGGMSEVIDLLTQKLADAAPKVLEAGKDLAVALGKGLLDAGIWGKLALGALIFKMLGGISALNASTAAGASMGERFGAGLRAGLMRMGIAAGLVGVFEAINHTMTDQGKLAAERFTASFGPRLQQLIEQRSIPALRRFDRTIQELGERTAELADQGWKDMGRLAAAFENSERRSGEALHRLTAKAEDAKQGIHELRVGYFRDLDAIRDKVRENTDKIANSMGTNSARGRAAMERNFQAAAGAIREAMREGRISSERGLDAIGDLLRRHLAMYGIKGPSAEKILKVQKYGPDSGQSGFATGGFINQGKPVGDSVPAMLERGEYVLNRVATSKIGKDTLDQINFAAAPRFQKGGSVLEALGPYSIPPIQYDANHAGGNSHVHLAMSTPAAVVALGKQLQRMGFMVSEHPAFGGVNFQHAPGGYHYSAQAIDVNTAADETRSEVARIAALLKGVGGALAGMARFKLPRFTSRFPVFAPAAGGLNNTAAGLEKIIGRRIGAIEGAEAGVSGSGTLSKQQIARIWKQANPFGSAGLMAAIALAESSGNPSAVGNDPGGTRGLGLWQITTGFNDDLIRKYGGESAMFNPFNNAQAAGDILQRQGLGAWVVYSTGAYKQFLQKGGQALPYLGSYHQGGIAAREGLAHVAKGEAMVPMQLGGQVASLRAQRRDLRPWMADSVHPAVKRRAERQDEFLKLLIEQVKELQRELAGLRRDARTDTQIARRTGRNVLADLVGNEIGARGLARRQLAGAGSVLRT